MTPSHPSALEEYLTREEGQKLEFKAKEAVNNRDTIPRAVAAMANAGGGDIVVGIREGTEHGGLELDPLPDFEAARRKVQDRIVSLLRPSPRFEIEELRSHGTGAGLLIRVKPVKGKALLAYPPKGSGQAAWVIPKRAGESTRPMEWPEVLFHFASEPDTTQPAPDLNKDLAELFPFTTSTRSEAGWFLFKSQLTPEIESDLGLQPAWLQKMKRWMVHPELLGVDRLAFHYGAKTGAAPIQSEDSRWIAGDHEHGYRALSCNPKKLEVAFATRLEPDFVDRRRTMAAQLGHPQNRLLGTSYPDFIRILRPVPLLSTLASLTRLQAGLLAEARDAGDVPPDARILATIHLIGCKGLRLGSAAYANPNRDGDFSITEQGCPVDDLLFTSPTTIPIDWFQPVERDEFGGDRLAHVLALRLFDRISGVERVPFYDEERGRFVFPK